MRFDTDNYEEIRQVFLDGIIDTQECVDYDVTEPMKKRRILWYRKQLGMLDDLLAEVERLREENELLRQGIIDACSTASSGAKRPVADGSIKHYLPLYLREMIE